VIDDPERDRAMTVRVDEHDLLRLTWMPGVRITGPLAKEAMDLVDELNVTGERPLLVDMTGTGNLTREARLVFTRDCKVTRLALLGRSPVDRVIANFALGVNTMAMPIRYFTSESAAVAWLCRGEPRA
jgi:hypothetical protein